MQIKTYQEATDWLFSQFPSYQQIGGKAYKPDLGNILLLTAAIGNPEKDLAFIHIAGTNGKGSSSSMLASILTESGRTTGLFTSPHIHNFRERIRVNGDMISEQAVIDFCNQTLKAALDFEPSFFEITFAMALNYFKAKKCDVCVIETGLGGRLDATNMIHPICCLITNISMEHTQFLGDTLEKIAGEKAGIIKPHVPVVISETTVETYPVFLKKAEEVDAPIIFCEKQQAIPDFELPLLGDYQQQNLKAVYYVIQELNKQHFSIDDSSIQKGLDHLKKNTGFFGRMEIISREPLTILDVSHNTDGIKKTLESVQKTLQGTLYLIYGTSSDKNYEEIISLFPQNAHLSFCTFNSERSLKMEKWSEVSKKLRPEAKFFSSVKEALTAAQSSANKEDTILVFGSFFLISDFF